MEKHNAKLTPLIDAIVGNLYLNHLCSTEAGVKVYQTMELPAEYWDENGRPRFFNERGYPDLNLMQEKLDEPAGQVQRYSSLFAIDKETSPVNEKSSQKMLEIKGVSIALFLEQTCRVAHASS